MKDNLPSLAQYLSTFATNFPMIQDQAPWEITGQLSRLLLKIIATLPADQFELHTGDVAIHNTAKIEEGVVFKGPMIISEGCFVGAHAYLRGGVFLARSVIVGPGCEIKTSIILEGSTTAHFNFVGDSIIGAHVNMEAGSIVANHYNERQDKTIRIITGNGPVAISNIKFGALIGDHCKIGANAVLSPGTILEPQSIVNRLALVDQCSA